MRGTARLFAGVRSAAKYLEPNVPTGLTGLPTHPAPRPALIYTYKQILSKLEQIPHSSVYRQSTEALTKHRLNIVEATKPEGYERWLERVKQQIEKSPEAYSKYKNEDGSIRHEELWEDKSPVWDGAVSRSDARGEGSNTMREADQKAQIVKEEVEREDEAALKGSAPSLDDLEAEPPLTSEQVRDIENKIGAGLIEEVVQVAEGELELVGEMLRYQVWEPLDEQTPSGQWEYFDRGDRV